MSPLLPVVTIKKRAEFLAAAAAEKKWVARFFVMQIGENKNQTAATVRYGLTASTRVGNAVVRNRSRRRLRALAREVLSAHADPSRTYVLIARAATATCSYDDMRQEMTKGLKRLKLWRD